MRRDIGTVTGTMQTGNEQGTESVELSTQVIEEVAQARGVDPLSLDPIIDSVDPDALDRIFESPNRGLQLTFEYEGYTVTVKGDRQIDLAE
ncbi:HalOD1 output domain-containing protein [Haloarchaeobius sp. HRN-SO-5]|uniref:HalOD1 output domain-containing protein n=1 Tax=Haloarchaeobius sp. HRN-SO-5 TaxID=3446118 RepID=UPI003EBC978C